MRRFAGRVTYARPSQSVPDTIVLRLELPAAQCKELHEVLRLDDRRERRRDRSAILIVEELSPCKG